MLELTHYVPGKSNPVIARRRPGNKGRRYPADPPRVEEIVAVMRQAGTDPYGRRLRGLIIVLWRAGLRISEALALTESDLEVARGSVLVRRGKGGRRREVGMDEWAWDQLRPWLEARVSLPVGPLFCVINGPTLGQPWSSSQVRIALRPTAARAGVRRRFAPHQLRHAHAVEMAREGVPLNVIQRRCRAPMRWQADPGLIRGHSKAVSHFHRSSSRRGLLVSGQALV
jgi:site-specific recombinase XerD